MSRVWIFFAIILAGGARAAELPTFYKDVLPVAQKHCQSCHRPGEVAPFSLTTYNEARPWSKAIRAAVLSRKMPPWSADPHGSRFRNDRSLSAAEIKTFQAWVDAGSPPGNEKDAPAPIAFTDGWKIQRPDAVLDTGVDFSIPESGAIEYQYFLTHTGFKTDKWISQIEVQPGNRAAVHHIVVFSRPPGSRFYSHAVPGKTFVPDWINQPPPAQQTSLGVAGGVEQFEQFGVYLPGGDPFTASPHQARLIRAGSDLIFEIHYTTSGKKLTDRSRIGMVFAPDPPSERLIDVAIWNNSLRIPAGAAAHRVDATVPLAADATIRTIAPHMHLRGKAFELRADDPTGKSEVLLSVPKYDFNWQLSYDFARPARVAKSTILRVTGWYDNSVNNPANPNPATEVLAGNQTWEEMLVAFVDFSIPANADPASLFPKGSVGGIPDPIDRTSLRSVLHRLLSR